MRLTSENSIQLPHRRTTPEEPQIMVLSETSVIASGCENWLSHLHIPHIAEKLPGRKAGVKAASAAPRSGRRALTPAASRLYLAPWGVDILRSYFQELTLSAR